MTYLKNEICEFEILFKNNSNIKYNILSTCFFRMNSHYKNFDIYINGLKRLIKLINTQKNYVLRIFIDEHIKSNNEIYNILKSSELIQIVVFKCSNYIKNNYHIDVFGALVRLFPIFNFELNDSNNVIVIDIDLNHEDINKLKILMNYETNTKEIIGTGTVNTLLINKNNYYYYAGLFGVFDFKFDKAIIIDFIKKAHTILDKGMYNKRLDPFGYGTDELFINKYLLSKDFISNNNIKFGLFLNYDINWFLYYYKNELLKDNPSKTYENLKFILGDLYTENMSIDNMFNTIDKLTYQIKSNNSNKIYISNRFYQLIKKIILKKEEWFSKEHINLIYKYYYDIVDCFSIVFYNPINLLVYDIKILKKNIIM